ncbi:MAG: hypothetical protein ACSHYA_09850 [Opitutaceae bacterium]
MKLRTYICSLALLALTPALGSAQAIEVRVMEETAIPFTGFLSKADFDRRFPGELVTDLSTLETGWYVIYEHEALSYYFGPILLESTGLDYLDKLESIVGDAVATRSSIEGYRLELSYEPQVQSESESSSETSEPVDGRGTPQPASKPSIFDFFRRLFGFG